MSSDGNLSSDELSSDEAGGAGGLVSCDARDDLDAYDELGPMCPQAALAVIETAPVPVLVDRFASVGLSGLTDSTSLSEVALAIVKEDARYQLLSKREKSEEMDEMVAAILAKDHEYQATLERMEGLMRNRIRAIDEKYPPGSLPEYRIPKCKGGGCEFAWALKVLTGG